MPSGTPMTPIGIWSTVNANVNAAMAPVASVDARLVMTRNMIWTAPRPSARGAISTSVLRASASPRSTRGVIRAPMRRIDGQLDEQVARARRATTPIARPTHAERRHEQQRAADDRDVVDDRRQRGRPEPALRVEDARRDRARREEQRRQDHDPGQLDGLGQLRLVEARRDDRRRAPGANTRTSSARTASALSIRVVTVDTTRQARASSSVANRPGDDRDHRRRQRPGRDELEQEVRDPERGEERVELRTGPGPRPR